ncbi:extracellular solute-binding protein [Pelagibacterium xiamenense]|uniref:extracellular solute-binding protein n=1 Tax=Pelagibacterium xiamenense TaxID=2901140 RepID=UPI001E32805E|nr:extracellular solute-binding protein [Pelagibacterium xiamenense]MCD7058933.1 extracellular solute-binding protein [Pelagibacterium xiamenense]
MLAKTLMASVAVLALGAGTALAQPVTIRVVSKDLVTTNPDDIAHIERIEEAMAAQGTEIDIEIVDLPSAGYQDKLALMLLSGDIPDLIYFQGGDEQFANQGLFEDWRPWIEDTEYLKDALWPHNGDRLDNYPYLLYVFPARTKSPVMREDWLAQTGLERPQTLEEWTEMMRVLAASDYDGNGEEDTYGIIAPDNTAELDAVFNQAFGVATTWMQNADGEWIHSRVSDAERDKLAYYQMLFAEGLLDPEFITSNWEVKEDKFYTGKVGIVMGTAGTVVDIYRTKMQQVNDGAELVLLDPPAGVGQGLEAVDVSKESRGFALSALSENKEEVVALMDFLASPEGQMFERMGFEGEHYTDNGGTYEITEAMGTWYPRFMIAQPGAWQPPVDLLSPVAQASLEQGAHYFTPDNAFVWPAEYAADVDAAENYYRTSVYRFVSGEWSMDQWDQYVQGWYDAGGQRLTEHARTVLP